MKGWQREVPTGENNLFGAFQNPDHLEKRLMYLRFWSSPTTLWGSFRHSFQKRTKLLAKRAFSSVLSSFLVKKIEKNQFLNISNSCCFTCPPPSNFRLEWRTRIKWAVFRGKKVLNLTSDSYQAWMSIWAVFKVPKDSMNVERVVESSYSPRSRWMLT